MKLSKALACAGIRSLLLVALTSAGQAADAAHSLKTTPLQPTLALLKNYSYVLNFPHSGMVAAMRNGVSQRYDIGSVNVQALGIGDLNGDGMDDAAVVLAGPDKESHLILMLNDGKRLIDTANLSAFSTTNTLPISHKTVHARFAKFDPDTLAFVGEVPSEVKLVHEPYLEADTYAINGNSASLVSDPTKYWDALTQQVEIVRHNDKSSAAQSVNRSVAITVNAPGTYVSTSSGNRDYDSAAYSWLASAVRDFAPPQGFANILEEQDQESLFTPRIHVEYRVDGDKITLRQTKPYKAVAFYNDQKEVAGSSLERSLAKDLTNQAKNFPYECAQRHIQLKNGNSQDCECRSVTIGDLDGDGSPDAVVYLSSRETGDCRGENYIVPLLNHKGRLHQPMRQCYTIKPVAEGSAHILKIGTYNGKIKILWQECSNDAQSSGQDHTHTTYATMIQLTPRLAAQEKQNGKVVWTQF
ncbi:MAG TPA: hypothetical protein V6D22_22405 [Candidatus Obscuribacterales bacterium]